MTTILTKLLKRVLFKIDQDLSDALYDQRARLEELFDEKILSLTPETLKMQQEIIKKMRELEADIGRRTFSGLSALVDTDKK